MTWLVANQHVGWHALERPDTMTREGQHALATAIPIRPHYKPVAGRSASHPSIGIGDQLTGRWRLIWLCACTPTS